jgi:hypothetical protein
MEKRRGRPIKDLAKNNVLIVRLSDDEREMIEYLASEDEMTKTDVIRKAVKAQYNIKKFLN